MWKNGQCVTVHGKKYRVKPKLHGFLVCNLCALYGNTDADCDSICFSKDHKLGNHQYLEEIPAKGKVLAK